MRAEDTIETAYARAQRAQRVGISTIDVLCDALRRTRKPIVEPFPGCRGFVRSRIMDDDGIAVQLIVRLDVTDVLTTGHDIWIRSLTPEQPRFRRRKKPNGIMRR